MSRKVIYSRSDRDKASETAILTDARPLWLYSRRKHCETNNLHEKAKVSSMLSCISFFKFIPGSVRNHGIFRVDDSVYKTGGRYAEVTVEVGPGTPGPLGPAGLQNL